MATIDTQTVSEWESLMYIPQLAFPTLFPTGQWAFNLNVNGKYLDCSIVAIYWSTSLLDKDITAIIRGTSSESKSYANGTNYGLQHSCQADIIKPIILSVWVMFIRF